MQIGMTGTREGLSSEQTLYALHEIPWHVVTELHSGDCVGADATLHSIAKHNNTLSIGHPPSNNEHRAYCDFDLTNETKGCLARNREIVHSSDHIYGFPPTEKSGKGGTWYTIKYAIQMGKPITVIAPSGEVTRHYGG